MDAEELVSKYNAGDRDFRWSELAGGELTAVNLMEVDLAESNLAGAQLSRADLHMANLTQADLTGADLSWAILSWANLSGARLGGADLRMANLTGARLVGANLAGATSTPRRPALGQSAGRHPGQSRLVDGRRDRRTARPGSIPGGRHPARRHGARVNKPTKQPPAPARRSQRAPYAQ